MPDKSLFYPHFLSEKIIICPFHLKLKKIPILSLFQTFFFLLLVRDLFINLLFLVAKEIMVLWLPGHILSVSPLTSQ